MIHDYLDSFVVGVNNNEPVDLMDIASNETEKIKQYIRNRLSTETYADATYYAPYRSLDGLQAYLKEEYKDYYVTLFETYGDNSHSSSYTVDKSDGAIHVYASDDIPYRNYDSWFIIISSVSFTELQSSPSLLDSETLVAFGVNFLSSGDDGGGDGGGGGGGGGAIEVNIPPINPSQYIKSLTADGGSIELSDVVGDESELLSNLFSGDVNIPIATNTYTLSKTIEGIVLELKEEYQNYKIATFRIFGVGQNMMEVNQTFEYTQDTFRNVPIPYEVIDDPLLYDSFLFIITSVDFEEFLDNPTLFDSEFIGAFGLTFLYDENVEDELPPEIINPTDLDATQYVRVLNGTTLAEYSIVPDVYNVKISQQINGLHTLTFNLLPYINASNIYTPRIVEVDGDYFHVQQITKRHELHNLEMDIYCEHVSYELNYPPPNREIILESVSTMSTSNSDEYEWSEDTYEGTAREILEELLYNSNSDRFSIGLVEDNGYHLFTTRSEGYRTRINEFAEYIGLEVKWSKFTVALLRKRGHDNGLVFEVGKNIVGLTEVIDTVKLGKTKRSYELDVIDLNYVKDELENPLEAHNISLGDVITIIDEQYRISRKDRVVALTRDPFQKALPTIEFTNNMASYTNGNSETSGSAIDIPIYQEDIERSVHANAFGYNAKATGDYSLAMGYDTIASGPYSTAIGYNTIASHYYDYAEGYFTEASGSGSHSEGSFTKATGGMSHAEGVETVAQGKASHSEGRETNALGENSHAQGSKTNAIGNSSHAGGIFSRAEGDASFASGYSSIAMASYSHAQNDGTVASGHSSTSMGWQTISRGHASVAMGIDTISGNDCSLVIGEANLPLHLKNSEYELGGDAFVIGNGFRNSRLSNAFRISFGGKVYAQGSYNSTGADYAEFFEWLDGNPNSEDRKGYVVTFEGDKIRIANDGDAYILGVVSSNPSIVGNSYQDQWQGKYVTDEWGNVQAELTDVEYPDVDENGERITVYRKEYVPIVDPNYDPEKPYIPRSQRTEWDAIGMLGKLLVRDDGTCEINKYAKLSETVNGVLTNSTDRSQFFVLRRINDNLVEVLIK